ncbi:MAG TPA: hypothetical protein PLU30_02445 [Verrucomicrobiae bacterium]|nr:hypothetical protein [Verrucomicrobiae bacterium]
MENDERLLRLLALKRCEKPLPGSLDNVVTEFHRRLRHEEIRRAQSSPAVLWSRLMDALLVEPLSLLRHVATGAAVAAGVMIGLGTLTLQKPAGAIPAVAQSSLRIDLEPSDDAAVRALVPARADALSLEAMADPDLGRQLARPLVPEPHAMPVSFDEANIVF